MKGETNSRSTVADWLVQRYLSEPWLSIIYLSNISSLIYLFSSFISTSRRAEDSDKAANQNLLSTSSKQRSQYVLVHILVGFLFDPH